MRLWTDEGGATRLQASPTQGWAAAGPRGSARLGADSAPSKGSTGLAAFAGTRSPLRLNRPFLPPLARKPVGSKTVPSHPPLLQRVCSQGRPLPAPGDTCGCRNRESATGIQQVVVARAATQRPQCMTLCGGARFHPLPRSWPPLSQGQTPKHGPLTFLPKWRQLGSPGAPRLLLCLPPRRVLPLALLLTQPWLAYPTAPRPQTLH